MEYDKIIGKHRITAIEGTVRVAFISDEEPTLTPGEASELATALTEASKVAVKQAKEIRAREAAFAAAPGPKHEEMW